MDIDCHVSFSLDHLHTLDPHDEPADVAGHLGDDVEPHHEVVMGGDEQDGQHQRGRGQHHAHAVNPSPPETIFNVCKMNVDGVLSRTH